MRSTTIGLMIAAILLTSGVLNTASATSPKPGKITPLHTAAEKGDALAVMQLIVSGADQHAFDQYGRTPLALAVLGGHVEVAELLLAGGADPNRCEANDDEPSYGVAPALFWAMKHDSPSLAHLLLEYAAEPNFVHTEPGYGTMFQSTPLHLAAQKGKLSQVRVLLDHGADANLGVWYGEMYYGDPDDPDSKFHGRTPLHEAAQHGHVDVARRLIHRGADIHARTHEGKTALELARGASHKEVSQLLIDHGAHEQSGEIETAELLTELHRR